MAAVNWRELGLFVAIALASAALCWLVLGTEATVAAGLSAAWQTADLIPRIVLGLIIAGMVAVLLPRAVVASWLGQASGLRGVVIATGLGAIMPGGPMTAFPLVVALFAAGADIGALVTFLTAWGVVSLQRMLVWEIPFMGADFALVRFMVCLPVPVMAGLLARWLARRHDVFHVPRPPER